MPSGKYDGVPDIQEADRRAKEKGRKRMIKLLQVNLNRSRRAHDAATLKVEKDGLQIILASEPNAAVIQNQRGWIASPGRCRIMGK